MNPPLISSPDPIANHSPLLSTRGALTLDQTKDSYARNFLERRIYRQKRDKKLAFMSDSFAQTVT